jgi:inhibitor of KinA
MITFTPRFLDQGEATLVVEFGDSVDPEINAKVLFLDVELNSKKVSGLQETTPSYRSLLICYEPLELKRALLIEIIEEILSKLNNLPPMLSGRVWTIPCCYDGSFAEDLTEAAQALSLPKEDISRLHTQPSYRVYMYGFAPGWCYLGGLPQALSLPRRLTPRSPTPNGAIMIGGGLSLIGTHPMPTGWYVIGRTPERLFSINRDPPFLLSPGDTVLFEKITLARFFDLECRVMNGEIIAKMTDSQ